MNIRKANEADLDRINEIYEKIHNREEAGLTSVGWIRNVYPTRATAKEAIGRDDLFVMEDAERIVCLGVINQIQVEKYRDAMWKHDAKDNEIMVLHGLAADPEETGKGYGKAFIAFYESYARKCGCLSLRMDTNKKNVHARRLYQKLGFEEVGIVKCLFNGIPDVELVCLEKFLGV